MRFILLEELSSSSAQPNWWDSAQTTCATTRDAIASFVTQCSSTDPVNVSTRILDSSRRVIDHATTQMLDYAQRAQNLSRSVQRQTEESSSQHSDLVFTATEWVHATVGSCHPTQNKWVPPPFAQLWFSRYASEATIAVWILMGLLCVRFVYTCRSRIRERRLLGEHSLFVAM